MKYTIYLDYQGTIVEAGMRRTNFGWVEVVKKLQDAGHTVILNTSYVDDTDKTRFNEALEMVNEGAWHSLRDRSQRDDFELKPIDAHPFKVQPCRWDFEQAEKSGEIYIDDFAYGIPLKRSGFTQSMLVDWVKVDEEFEENGLYIQE